MGWDKVKVPESFIDFLETLVFKRAGIRSPSQRGKPWRANVSSHLHNLRTSYYYFIGAKARDQHEWFKLRYQDKVDFYNDFFVSDFTRCCNYCFTTRIIHQLTG